jgi:hypothetical protein
MEQVWQDSFGKESRAPIEARIIPFVEAIGIDATADLFQHLGGSEVYLPRGTSSTQSLTLLGMAIGQAKARELGRSLGYGRITIPVGSKFLARYLRGKGFGVAEIARRIRKSEDAVRRSYLNVSTTDVVEADDEGQSHTTP